MCKFLIFFSCSPALGSKERKIPYPTSHPMTQLFRFVSCPNYTYEVSSKYNRTDLTIDCKHSFFSASSLGETRRLAPLHSCITLSREKRKEKRVLQNPELIMKTSPTSLVPVRCLYVLFNVWFLSFLRWELGCPLL